MTNYVKEEYIRKYADKDIVEALDKSIKDHLEYFIGCHKAFQGEEPNDKKMKEIEDGAHKSALGWIDRHYYTQYNFDKSDPEYEHKMEMRKNYRNLINSMTKEEIKKEDDFLKESEREWNDFLKTLDFKDPDAWRAELNEG